MGCERDYIPNVGGGVSIIQTYPPKNGRGFRPDFKRSLRLGRQILADVLVGLSLTCRAGLSDRLGFDHGMIFAKGMILSTLQLRHKV